MEHNDKSEWTYGPHSAGICWPDAGGCGEIIHGTGPDGEITRDSWSPKSGLPDALCDACFQKRFGTSEPDVSEWLESQPTREEWLQRRLYDTVRPLFAEANHVMPAIRVACGWTGAGFEACTLGVCYDKKGSAAGVYEIFVSPTQADPIAVVAIMMHEVAHAVAGCDAKHDVPTFGAVAASVDCNGRGADGKGRWPEQAYPSPALVERLTRMSADWEPYPHAALNPPPPSTASGGGGGSGDGGKTEGSQTKQGTRLLKASCKTCGYTVRITMKWAQRGLPICGICCDSAGDLPRMQLEEKAGES